MDENIGLSWLKFYLSRAPGQVIFLPLWQLSEGGGI